MFRNHNFSLLEFLETPFDIFSFRFVYIVHDENNFRRASDMSWLAYVVYALKKNHL